ncbi:MAG: nucleoside triphosphate pyrophosphohydrolase [Woeseia sp.]
MSDIEKLLHIMAALRDAAHGCPWDQAQDFATIAPYTVEEAYEVADAIARNDLENLRDELGDLLFQVVFHARIAEEAGAFRFADVTASICAKLLRRHPHVFGTPEERARGATAGSWEQIKATEREEQVSASTNSALDDVAVALPALTRAQKLGVRAAASGFDWPDRSGPRAKIDEELGELEQAIAGGDTAGIADELGDLLFATVNLARHLDVDAEQALRNASSKFERRFRVMETDLGASGTRLSGLGIEALEAYWQAAKHKLEGY